MARPLQQQIIARALELIADEANWTRVYIARGADGAPCSCMDAAATRFCAIGALVRAARDLLGENGPLQAYAAEKFILKANNRPYDTLPCINDIEGHAVIIAMFKHAFGVSAGA
jgi:hypothetical protein